MASEREANRIRKTNAIMLDPECSQKLQQLAAMFAEDNRSRMVRMLIREAWEGLRDEEKYPKPAKEQL